MSRLRIVLSGVVLGVVWGSVMWLVFELTGRESGVRGWAYLAITIAMLGGGVAAFFGAIDAQARGRADRPAVRRRPARPPVLTGPGALAPALAVDYPRQVTVLGGELAVPCTRNPLQRGLIPVRGAGPWARFRAEQRRWRGPIRWATANQVRSGRKQP